MSVISVWVKSTDGLLYRDPVLRGISPYDWFLCFDEDEPPELVLSIHGRKVGNSEAFDDASNLLDRLGIKATITAGPFRCTRCFSGDAQAGPYLAAAAFYMSIMEPIPRSLLAQKRGSVQPAGGDCVVYAFGETWG